MTKLTFTKSTSNEEEDEVEVRNTGSLSVTKKSNKPVAPVVKQPEVQVFAESSVSSYEDISDWLLTFIGESVFKNLKGNPHLQLPYTDSDEMPVSEWLLKALKTIFTQDQIKEIGTQILQNQRAGGGSSSGEVEALQKAFDEKMVKINARFEKLKEEAEEAQAEKFEAEKEMQGGLAANLLVTIFFKDEFEDTQHHKKLRSLLNDATENSSDETATFIAKLGKGWTVVKKALSALEGHQEMFNMEAVYKSTIQLLEAISGSHIAERREALDIIAEIISENFSTYEFISPEQTLQLDPAIHNAHGLGTATIKEGVSFAVIRKESRQAVKYADVKV